MTWRLETGDCLEVLKSFPDGSIDSCVTDPPYGLEFMGKEWDKFRSEHAHASPSRSGAGLPRFGSHAPFASKQAIERLLDHRLAYYDFSLGWAQALLRVLKPGGMLLAFGGTRTHHRLMCAIEDAGFKVRDCLMWLYGQGFPKSLNISKAIDKAAGAEREVVGVSIYAPRASKHGRACSPLDEPRNTVDIRELTAPETDAAKLWDGYGTALKPAFEPIILAMKPMTGPFAQNALAHGVAGLNIDGCRTETTDNLNGGAGEFVQPPGRWPANVVLDEEAGKLLDAQSGTCGGGDKRGRGQATDSGFYAPGEDVKRDSSHGGPVYIDTGGASRFFYCAKASRSERTMDGKIECQHPTVKPLSLMRWLCRLCAPPSKGVVLDPFTGSGSTGVAAILEGRSFVGIELNPEYIKIARNRLREAWVGRDT
jgi:DNA modification methylase